MKPIPTEMRTRILDDLNSGMTWLATAEKWKISQSFIAKLKRQVRNTGSIEPIKPKTGPKPKLAPHYQLLQKIIAETPDATLAEIQDLLPIKVSHQTVADALHKLKLVYKKKH
jgi:transposase